MSKLKYVRDFLNFGKHPLRFYSKWKDLVSISKTVSKGLLNNEPMVVLESTVVTHGLPWPINFQTASSLEAIVTKAGAIPATVGILDQVIKAGFSSEELDRLSKSSKGKELPRKVSRRDLYNVSNMKYGGTTVSATMSIAHKLGIKVFATGGIGGVHRNVYQEVDGNVKGSMDISADLRELGRTPVCVVSSGIKSFLDIPRTLEYLETEGVFVGTLGSEEFPGFFVKSSGVRSPYKIDTVEEAAAIIFNMENLDIGSGMILAIPIPGHLEEDGILIQDAIEESLLKATKIGICGAEVTPFLLSNVNQLTKGKSMELNVKLLENNAFIGAHVAIHLHKMKKKSFSNKPLNHSVTSYSKFAVIGSSIVDNYMSFSDPEIKGFEHLTENASYSCTSFQSSGGVARNMANVFSLLGEKCHFLSVLGNDLSGEFLRNNSNIIDWSKVKRVDGIETANCSVIMSSTKNILFHIGNFDIAKHISLDYVKDQLYSIKDDLMWICIDSNITQEVMKFVINWANSRNIRIFVEPTDILLVHRPLEVLQSTKTIKNPIHIISPNYKEFQYLYKLLRNDKRKYGFEIYHDYQGESCESPLEFVQFVVQNTNLLNIIPKWIIKLGSLGVFFASEKETFFIDQSDGFIRKEEIVNASGAGDCLAACALYLHYKENLSWQKSLSGGLRMAKESLLSQKTVPDSVDPKNYVKDEIERWVKEMTEKNVLKFK